MGNSLARSLATVGGARACGRKFRHCCHLAATTLLLRGGKEEEPSEVCVRRRIS